MLCIDTNSLIAYLEGRAGEDVELVDQAFGDRVGAITPVILTEMLSDASLIKPVEVVEKPPFASPASARDRADAIACRATQRIVGLFVPRPRA